MRGIRTGLGYKIQQWEELSLSKRWFNKAVRNRGSKQIDKTPYSFMNLQLLVIEDGHLDNILRTVGSSSLIWLRWKNCPYSCLPPWFSMKNIRVLEVAGSKLKIPWLPESQVPLELRELNIDSPLLEFPKSIGQLKHIEKIVVTYGLPEFIELRALPEEFCHLRSLKYLHLSCPHMQLLPDSFGYLTNLQHLHLSRSKSLRMLPNSFRNLIHLKYLNLQSCFNLTMSEETFGNINTLEYLELSGCKKLEILPAQVTHQQSLQVIRLFNTRLKELPSDIGNLSSLEFLSLESPLLEMLPFSLGHLGSLKELSFIGCHRLQSLPDSLGRLTSLSTLSIRNCGILSLPPAVLKMNNLVRLTVKECPLSKLPLKKLVEGEGETSTNQEGRREAGKLKSSIDNAKKECVHQLEYLELDRTKISEISFHQDLCVNLKRLHIYFCPDLVEVGALPLTLERLELVHCPQLRKIEGLCNVVKLRELTITYCEELEALPCLERLVLLEKFWAPQCPKLRGIRGLAHLAKLRVLHVDSCYALEQPADVEAVTLMESIYVQDLVGR